MHSDNFIPIKVQIKVHPRAFNQQQTKALKDSPKIKGFVLLFLAYRELAGELGLDYFCMTQETVRRLPFRCYTRKGSDLDQSQQRKR